MRTTGLPDVTSFTSSWASKTAGPHCPLLATGCSGPGKVLDHLRGQVPLTGPTLTAHAVLKAHKTLSRL